MEGAIARAKQLAGEIARSFVPNQFSNQANPDAHYKTTGPEIFQQLEGRVDVFVAGVDGSESYLSKKIYEGGV